MTLDREEARYLAEVMRVRPGQPIELFDGRGRVAPATVESVERRQVTVAAGPTVHHPDSTPRLCLVQALPKAQKMDWIVQKSTELGVHHVQPVHTRHAVARPDPARGGRKADRWQSVALAAIRQCGAAHLPTVAPVITLDEWVGSPHRPRMILVGDLRPGAEPVRDVVEPMRACPPDSIAFVIGPEGDLAPEELDLLNQAEARFVNLGTTTLRTETAAIYAIGLLRYALM